MGGQLLLQVAGEAAEMPGGYGAALLQTLFALVGVCILAWVVLRWGARRGLGMGGASARMRVMERVALDARRSLFLVEVGGRVLLVGSGDGGSPTLLTEIDKSTLPVEEPARSATFADVMKKFRREPDQDKPT